MRLGSALVAWAATIALLAAAPAVAAPPTITYTLEGPPGDAGWLRGRTTVTWAVSGTTTQTDGCNPTVLGNDTAGVQLTCTAFNGAASTTATTEIIRIDQTPPGGLTAVPVRPPDAAPWYTAPVAVAWSGADPTSGIASCTALTYTGPDGAAVAPAGTCRDVAGNVSAPVPFPLAYDATPPALTGVGATVAHRTAALRWTPGADAQQVTIVRTPGDAGAPARTVTDGPGTVHEIADGPLSAGTSYTWTVTVRDVAGNATSATATAAVPHATKSTAKPTTKSTRRPPTLRWRARAGAKYYNLQLFRNGRKILSAWPSQAHYTLRATWRFGGHRHRLVAGRYRWFVWPGYGRRSQHRYGSLLARGTTRVPPAR
jgi:hypothetical protein